MQIVEQTGLSWAGVNAALRLFEQGGAAALKPHARGKKPGSGRSLTPEQERAIRMTIIDKRPEQIKMEFALWSRPAVRELIELDAWQIGEFAGNALELSGRSGERLLALSERACASLSAAQKAAIERSATLLPLAVPTIELAGGSVRCMLAGIHLARR